MIRILTQIATIVLILVLNVSTSFGSEIEVSCSASEIGDQDDMCIWVHPEDPSLSTIITSDKDKSTLFVYSLAGEALFSYPLSMKPGNIDLIYNFPLDGELIDVVGFNERTTSDARFVFY